MSRAVLVMDKPERCAGCPLEDRLNVEKTSCRIIPNSDMTILQAVNGRHAKCPLRPVPDKKDMKYMDDKSEYFRQGWNACIDGIGGGENDN